MFLISILFIAGAVSGQQSENNGTTQLKVIHLSPDAGSVSVFVNDKKIGTNIGFGDFAGTEIEAGVHEVRVESDNIDLSRNVNLRSDRTYTLTVNNRAFSPDTTLISHNTSTTENRAKIRLAHFSPDLLNVNANLENGGSFRTRALRYLEVGRFSSINPGNYTVQVTESRLGGTSFERQIRLRRNTSYTAFIAGLKTGTSDQRLRIIPLSGRLETQIEDEENGDSNDDGDTENGREIRQDFSLVCRFENTSSN